MLPTSMDNQPGNGTYGKDGVLQEWQRNTTESPARVERPVDPHATKRVRPGHSTIRAVTPDQSGQQDAIDIPPSVVGPIHTSPRSMTGGERMRERRQGLVFQDSYDASSSEERSRSGPPVSLNSRQRNRTWTKDNPTRQRSNSSTVSRSRRRVGSVNSATSSSLYDVQGQPGVSPTSPSPHDVLPAPGYANSLGRPSPTLQKSNSVKGGRRLIKKSSRPASPSSSVADVPSVDSLPTPVATGDANKILMLMKELCGRMRGEVEYQFVENGPWYVGTCYIDEKGSLMHEGDDRGPFHITVISDLRGCRVKPINSIERQVKCLKLSHRSIDVDIYLLPVLKSDYDRWLAALLCWQQIRAPQVPPSPSRSSPTLERRPGASRRDSGLNAYGSKAGNIIKVAKLLLWDKGAPSSPTAIVRRTSTRDLRSPSRSLWRRVSCILQDNGEFKLLTENDVTLLSVIQLSQLSRCSIQRLDRSVLDEEFCIAIFPQYTSTSTQLSIFRPVYIALESRLTHEVWFCLLRAFTIPEIYGPQLLQADEEIDFGDSPPQPATNDMFRIEKSIICRIIEAKIRRPSLKSETIQVGKPTKVEADPSIGDYFVEVVLDGEIRARTITRTETKNPFWREDCEFHDLPAHLPRLSIVLKQIQHPPVSSHGFLSSVSVHIPAHTTEETCATIEIPIEKFERGKDNETWWPLLDRYGESLGEILVRIRHEELVVLLAKDYQPISDLLHNFGTGLTVQIAQVIPTSLRALSETLTNIFQVSGRAGDWLTTLVEEEIDGLGREPSNRRLRWSRRIGSNESFSSVSDREQQVRDMGKSLQGEANLLFRGNSLLTQALDFHMRRLGKEYLEEVLSEKIIEINSLNPDCEVDPSRISHNQDVHKNWSTLISLTTDIWESISASATRCPPELRKVFKYIRAVAEDRYGDFLRTVAYTSVSGFIFLRFFCPAILNPKLFGLLRDHPPPKSQRALTLIAKSLQALANLSTFGQKESWMEPMNRFLSSNRQGVKDFLDSVCAISVERNTFSLPASYSTPTTILARLPLTSREGFPSLPYLIDYPRNFATLVKLWLDAVTQFMAPEGLEGDLLEFHDLCLKLQSRTNDCLLKAEQADQYADQLSLQWEDIVESLDITTIRDVANRAPGLPSPPWAEFPSGININRGPPGSAGSEVGRDKKERQGFWESTFGKENRSNRSVDPLDPSQSSPPSRGQSRNGKSSRNFLSGLRRKEKRDPSNPVGGDLQGIASSPPGQPFV